jgi:hypothetical protein
MWKLTHDVGKNPKDIGPANKKLNILIKKLWC